MLANKEIKSTYYQVFLESFVDSNSDGIGDIRGFRGKLSIIGQLGVNYCLLNQVFDTDGDKVNYKKIKASLGDENSIKLLCQKAKEFRMKIILDFDFKDLYNNFAEEKLVDEFLEILKFWKEEGITGFRVNNLDLLFEKYKDESEQILKKIKEKASELELIFIGGLSDQNLIKNADLLDMVYLGKANSLIKEKNSYKEFYEFIDSLQEKNDIHYGIDFNNISSPRLIDKVLDDEEESKAFVTGLAILLLTLDTIPFIYQGEEIEAKSEYNVHMDRVNDEAITKAYDNFIKDGLSEEEALKEIKRTSNFSSKIPIRWEDSTLGGFSEVKNYYGSMVNLDNNFKKYLKDGKSFFFVLHEAIMLRKRISAFGLGEYEKLSLDDSAYIYKKTFKDESYVILVNLSDDFYEVDEKIAEEIADGQIILNNNRDFEAEVLDAYQSVIIKL